jgi:hypothetical protein
MEILVTRSVIWFTLDDGRRGRCAYYDQMDEDDPEIPPYDFYWVQATGPDTPLVETESDEFIESLRKRIARAIETRHGKAVRLPPATAASRIDFEVQWVRARMFEEQRNREHSSNRKP